MSNASPANVTDLCRAVLQWGRGVVGHAYSDGRYDDGPHDLAAEFIVQNLRRLDCDLAPCYTAILASKPSLDRLRDEPVTAGEASAPSAHELARKLSLTARGVGAAAIKEAWGVSYDEVRGSLAAWSDHMSPAICALGLENDDIGTRQHVRRLADKSDDGRVRPGDMRQSDGNRYRVREDAVAAFQHLASRGLGVWNESEQHYTPHPTPDNDLGDGSVDTLDRRPALVAFRDAEEVRNGRLRRLREAVRKRLDNHWLRTELSYAACERLDAMIQGEAARLLPVDPPKPPNGQNIEPTGKTSRQKRSTRPGDKDAKLIAALTAHHKYADGGCLNPKPMGNNELARLADVSTSTAKKFLDDNFRGLEKYQALCQDSGRLAAAIKLLNGEFAPHYLYGGRPTGEGGRDDD